MSSTEDSVIIILMKRLARILGRRKGDSISNSGDRENCEELSQKQKPILALKLIGKSNEEVAKILGLPMDELEREIREMTGLFKKEMMKE